MTDVAGRAPAWSFRAAGFGERLLFAAVLLSLPLVAASLRLFGLRRVEEALLREGGLGSATPAAPVAEARLIAGIVNNAASRWPRGASCLTRSVTLRALLHARGIESRLRIGVRKSSGELEAHAWVECGGVVVNDGRDVGERYAAFDGALRGRQ